MRLLRENHVIICTAILFKYKVAGSILNQFSTDEYEGNLRVSTINRQKQDTNSVYILDKDLNERGKIESLALGEKIYSVQEE